MTHEITIQITVGNLAFSFKTDGSGTGIEEDIRSIQKILKTHGPGLTSIRSERHGKNETLSTVALPSESLADLNIKTQLKDKILADIRKVPYWNLVLTILYHSQRSLGYDALISISREMGKPISYDWLNTEFQRTKYRGLVRSEEVPGSKKRRYSITELGRKRAESFFRRIEIVDSHSSRNSTENLD